MEGDWSNYKEKGFCNYINGGSVEISAAFNIQLNSMYSGGVVAVLSQGYLTILEAIGTVSSFMKDESGRALSSEIVGYLDYDYSTIIDLTLDVNDKDYCDDAKMCIGT